VQGDQLDQALEQLGCAFRSIEIFQMFKELLVEIGMTRENIPQQKSTEKLAIFTAILGMRFVTVDMDQHNVSRVKSLLGMLNPNAQAICDAGENYLALQSGSIDYVYLDAYDIAHGMHSEARNARYMEVFASEINDEDCWRMHARCAELLIQRMRKGAIVVLDDTWLDSARNWSGKGKTALPLLTENGFSILSSANRENITYHFIRSSNAHFYLYHSVMP